MKRVVVSFMAPGGPSRSPGRLRLALLATLAAVAVALGLSPVAGAQVQIQNPPDPLTTNIPYLAWRGEEVRVVKCFRPVDLPVVTGIDWNTVVPSTILAKFLIEDWSGDPHVWPQFEDALDGIVGLFRATGPDHEGELCAGVDVVSLKAGLAVVKLVGLGFGGGPFELVPTAKHQFLVAWMNLNDPVLRELPGGGDPDGNGILFAGDSRDNHGFMQVRVSGTIPMGNNFAGIFRGDQVTLPAQWADLANVFAIEGDPDNPENGPGGAAAMRWDIHDDDLPTEGHRNNPCADSNPLLWPPIDAVDNCAGGFFNFSTIWGGLSLNVVALAGTFGPFDPLRPTETVLSDGKLDWGDAPMPAARVDFAIAPNTLGKKDGVGSLVEVQKRDVYRRGLVPSYVAQHDLYAPFYFAWLLARDAGFGQIAEASGIDGPPHGNNFPGFLDGARRLGSYVFWLLAAEFESDRDGDGNPDVDTRTSCLRRFNDYKPELRDFPRGPDRVVVYTDEHGEARVAFLPGLGFYFDNFGVFNANGGCDLQGIEVLGRAFITATAKYPYQPVFDVPHVSNELEKIVKSRFSKHLGFEPKGPGEDNDVARIVHATAIDIDGTPFTDELVCFSADKNAESMQAAPGFYREKDPNGIHRLCVRTNSFGVASIEVFNSNRTRVDVIAHFIDEQLLRHIFIDFGKPPGPGGVLPPTPGKPPVPPPPGVLGAGVPTAAQLHDVLGGIQTVRVVTTFRRAHFWAKIMFTKQTGRAVCVQVTSRAKKARVEIRLLDGQGRLIRIVHRWVATNRKVIVPGLHLPKKVESVRIRAFQPVIRKTTV